MVGADDAEELALIAKEIGAQVIRGRVRYPGRDGGLDVGGVDVEEFLYELKDHEVMIIIAPLGAVRQLPTICGLCMTPYTGDECPTCRMEREEAKRVIERRLRQTGKLDRTG